MLSKPVPRRLVGALLSLFLPLLALGGLAAPAHAEDGYEYWMYFHLDGETWKFSDVGPADYTPQDGEVEGFRFGVSTANAGLEPRADLAEVNFESICAGADAADGEKRVAVVLDFGTGEESSNDNGTPPEPRAECVVAPEEASTQDVLGEIVDLRLEGGMACAFDGYPATGCGAPVKNVQVPTDEETVEFALPASEEASDSEQAAADVTPEADDEGSSPWRLVGIALLVVLIGAAAVLLTRRNRSA